jgi:hypothetical protein
MEISPGRKRFLWRILAGVIVLNALIFRLRALSTAE